MGNSVQGLEILFWAAVAGIVLFRLRSVLGRRTGNERPPRDRLSRESSAPAGAGDKARAEQSGGDQARDGVIALPGTSRVKPAPDSIQARLSPEAIGVDPNSRVADALTRIRALDRYFDPIEFLAGAKSAYAMIIESFASGDEAILKPLLSADVLADFRSAISSRAARGETVESRVADIAKAEITDAELNGSTAEITLRFESDIVRCVRDSEHRVIEGDPTEPSRTTDVWTFSRDVESDDPNWTLIATSSEH